MKRVSVLILAFILVICVCSAWAQEIITRESTVLLEGMDESIETRYDDPDGLTFWYSADLFAVSEEYGNIRLVPLDETIENMSLMIVPVDIPVEESEAFIHEATGGYMPGEAEISEITESKLESGLDVKHVQAVMQNEIHSYYLITGEDKVYCVTAIFPVEAAEGFGARMAHIISTFEIASAE